MQSTPKIHQELVLVGGGHAHALALRMLAMQPIEGLRITLISPASHTPYSGMLPGLVAGHYNFEQAHIDLTRLCQWAGVRFIQAEVLAVDPKLQLLSLGGRPSIAYDVLSIDVGSQPELDSVPGARSYSIPVKPVAQLWQSWRGVGDQLGSPSRDLPLRLAVVGGGAGSVELIAAMAERGSAVAANSGEVSYQLFCGSSEILPGYNARARRAAQDALASYGVVVHLESRVEKVESGCLTIKGNKRYDFDQLFWCTGAVAAPWLANSTLRVDKRGFLAQRNTLQCLDYDNIFAAGDCATQLDHPRPKAGVYAVRQAPVLAQNLRAFALRQPLKEHHPQTQFLSLLSLGEKRATADRGALSVTGAWVWRWKDRIDQKFMSRFTDLPLTMPSANTARLPQLTLDEQQMPCGGCGAKVGAHSLATVLRQLTDQFPQYCSTGDGAQDAALIPTSGENVIVQSIDTLRQMVADPWLMGRIAANHALSDLYASGARPVSALASIGLPFAGEAILERDLTQILSGALHEFAKVGCQLSGGHSMQGCELTIGFVVNGRPFSSSDGFLGKQSVRAGDALVLTKPLGTGTLFAGQMQLVADGRDVSAAIEMMLHSNAAAGELAVAFDAVACTDVTGFGLLGHLGEMLGSDFSAVLDVSAIPLLPGALALAEAGIHSTMHASNLQSAEGSTAAEGVKASVNQLLSDPQTSGGLLMAVSSSNAVQLCDALAVAGYSQASVIGKIKNNDALHKIDLRGSFTDSV
jgi:selenide,water dikinase